MKKNVSATVSLICDIMLMAVILMGCAESGGSYNDVQNTMDAADTLQSNQPTPTDLSYSLERYN